MIVTAHLTVAGLGLGSMEYERVVEVVNLFILLYHSSTPSAPLLNESLELIQVEVGINTLVLEADYRLFSFLATKCWVQSLWEAISEFRITIYIPNHVYWVSSRINDSTIIQKAVSLKVFSKEEVQAINRVRIALQIVFLSELVLDQSLQVAPKFRGHLLGNYSATSYS